VAYVHGAYTESHWESWWAYGATFLAMAVGQGLFAALLMKWPRPWLIWSGIAGNLAIIGMYVVSRTEGVPLGPHAKVAEEVGAVDLATTAAEIGIVVLLLTMVGKRARAWAFNLLLLGGLSLWAMRVAGYLG